MFRMISSQLCRFKSRKEAFYQFGNLENLFDQIVHQSVLRLCIKLFERMIYKYTQVALFAFILLSNFSTLTYKCFNII